MYQFTREFIINDNVGKIGGKRFDVASDVMYVDNMVNIRKKDVNAIYKHAYVAPVNESVTVADDVFTAAAGEVVRLVITLGLRGKTSAPFNDHYPDHSRHLFYETTVQTGHTSAGDIVDGLLASVAHEATLHGEKFVELSKSNSDLKIDALDCYTIIKEIRLVKLPQPSATAKIGALLTGYEDWTELLIWKRGETNTNVTVTYGKEGNGTTVQILKNMRLQTAANLNPYGFDMDERPVPAGTYDQYTVEIVTERRHIGHDVMGSVGTSLTTFVFYVLTGAVSTAFNTALSSIGTVETASSVAEPAQVLAKASEVAAVADSVEEVEESIPTKATLTATSVDGTNPTEDIELALS